MDKMEDKLLLKLLQESEEKDRFDYKREMKIFQSNGKPAIHQRDELLKDILGLANGNSHIVRDTKYLIIGVDDEKFDDTGTRILHNVDYQVPTRSELTKWLNSASSPAVVGIECETVQIQGANLFVITIPPTFNLHETTRDLKAKGLFHEHTVFMRQDEHTVIASVQDGITIQNLKYLHRQEISRPSSLWMGAITGGIVSFIVSEAKINSTVSTTITEPVFKIILLIVGILYGTMIGWFGKAWNESRYDFRYMSLKQKIISILFLILFLLISLYFLFLNSTT